MNVHDIKVDYSTTIPNNVGLGEDRRVLKALESWHPGYIDWWHDMGPEGFQESLVYLRTAYSVDPRGWAKFDYVRMPEYRWGILLAPQEENRVVPFGESYGEPAWQDVPGEHRAMLRRLIVIQGDTEPASVEQQRHLGKTAPSLYDMRNLFQVNVEEGRHLWAMVYLLQKYFGRDGREEADELLRRRSGSADSPRMLGAFNEATPDWLSFFMFTYFTDRDGKMQLHSLAQSGFDPLSRTCRFMLTEEAHHMFVGETGISRVVQRTCDAMKAAGISDPNDVAKVRALGVIDLPTIQKKLNLHYSLSLDLFGSEVSTNAANAFNAGIKGRYRETQIEDDHKLQNDTYPVLKLVNGEAKRVDEPALTALNMRLRDDYTQDCVKGLLRWNKIISLAGYDYKLTLPNVAFHRQIGEFKAVHATPDGVLIDDAAWDKGKSAVAALDRGRRLHRQPDEPALRDRRVRGLDRAAEGRHRQQAGRFRIREDRDLMSAQEPKPGRAENTGLLAEIGALVRNERAKRGITRKVLARQCQTSERYLGQIETGEANPSVLVLDAVARALDLDPIDLMPAGREARSRARVPSGAPNRARRIALIGLRGAGKSTLGAALADKLGCPFVEIDKMIEREHGAPVATLFEVYGQGTFRRYERECLQRIVATQESAVIATAGGIVADDLTFEQLLRRGARDLAARDAGRAHAPRNGARRLPPDGAQSATR